jgi:hypothetical protein
VRSAKGWPPGACTGCTRGCTRSATRASQSRAAGWPRRLQPEDVTAHDTIPCTTVARTLLDLADVVNRRQLERACDEAEVRRLLDATALDAVLSRANGRRGAPVLRAILGDYDIGEGITRNDFEEAFLTLCDRAGLPRPEIVETDGRAAHATRRAFEHDRRRDQRLLAHAGQRA